jgi:hypothetical protein
MTTLVSPPVSASDCGPERPEKDASAQAARIDVAVLVAGALGASAAVLASWAVVITTTFPMTL